MWECSKCHETVEDQFAVCWNCGTSRDGRQDPRFGVEGSETSVQSDQDDGTASGGAPNSDDSPEKVLGEILDLQKQQQASLQDIQSKVGCLYMYMIVGIVLGILAGLMSLGR